MRPLPFVAGTKQKFPVLACHLLVTHLGRIRCREQLLLHCVDPAAQLQRSIAFPAMQEWECHTSTALIRQQGFSSIASPAIRGWECPHELTTHFCGTSVMLWLHL